MAIVNGLAVFVASVSAQVPVFLQKGLRGEYFSNPNLTGTPLYRRDPVINFNWGNQLAPARHSQRWLFGALARIYYSQVLPKPIPSTSPSDNGRRLWVNEQLIINAWNDDFGIDYTGQVTLTAGVQYYIQLEYFENVGGAGCQMEWESASQARQIVPENQLIPEGAELPPIKIATNTLMRDPQDDQGTRQQLLHDSHQLLFGQRAFPRQLLEQQRRPARVEIDRHGNLDGHGLDLEH